MADPARHRRSKSALGLAHEAALHPGRARDPDRDSGLPVQAGLRRRERQAELVARGASWTMHSRHLSGHAVDLVALDGGEVSWQWEDYFRVAAAIQAAPHELEVPVCWGGCWDSLLAIASPKTASPTTSRPAGQPARSRSWTARTSSCRGPAGMIDWIKTAQGVAAIVAVIFATVVT